MSRRSDVKSVLAGQRPEYVPWFADLDYWMNYLRDEKLIPKKYLDMGDEQSRNLMGGLGGGLSAEGLQALHNDLGIGFYLQGYFPFETIYHNVKVETEDTKEGTVTRYYTPYGTLTEVWKYIKSTYSLAPVEYLIKSAEDLKAYQYIYENIEYKADYRLAERRLDVVGSNGIVVAYTPKSPMMELVALKAGLETVVTELMSEVPDELDELLECMRRKHTEAAQIAIDSQAECIFVPDNLSSEMVGGSIYDNYIREVHEEWTQKIRLAGKKSMVHLDGTLRPLLSKLSKAGFDVIEAVTPAPVGDIELEELRDHVQEETIIWGGIPGGFFADSYPEEEFEGWVRRALDVMKKDRHFVMGVADQVVPGSSFERLKKVAVLVKRYGKSEG